MASTETRFAVVGAGPAGFYCAEALLRCGHGVDLFDRLPTPYGLVRYGVAPDHPKLKSVTTVFQRIAQMPGFRFLGNVCIGRDLTIAALRSHYRAVIVCCGAERDRQLGIPGEYLAGVHGGLAFVGWYNGHPGRAALAPQLAGCDAVVIGMGNVALDVARILSKPAAELASTDIAAHALSALGTSGIKRVTVASRGGPAQARCTEKELREFRSLNGCITTADSGGYAVLPGDGMAGIFSSFPTTAHILSRHCHFAFGMKPLAIVGENGRVRAVRFSRAPLREGIAHGHETMVEVPADLVVTCIGSRATQIDGLTLVPDEKCVLHAAGRSLDANGDVIPGLYVSGWIKRGASGTIGTNRADAVKTVESILADLPDLPKPTACPDELMATTIMNKATSFEQWTMLDSIEIRQGANCGRPRNKFVSVEDMLKNLKKVD